MKKIGIDIGFGDTKVCSDNGCFKFKTVLSEHIIPQHLKNEFTKAGIGKEKAYEYDGKRYLIGDENVRLEKAKYVRSPKYIVKYSPLFVKYILDQLNVEKEDDVSICMGLSISHYDYAEEMIRNIKNFLNHSGKIDIFCYPQGFGVITLVDGASDPKTETLIIDIGSNTVDFIYFKGEVPVSEHISAWENHGVQKIIRNFGSKIDDKHVASFNVKFLENIFIDGKYAITPERILDFSIEKEEAISDYAENFIEELITKQEEIIYLANRIVPAGGGAYYVTKRLKEEFGADRVYEFGSQYEFLNVKGYYNALQ